MCLSRTRPIPAESLPTTHADLSGNWQYHDCSFIKLIAEANGSAAGLVNILARDFRCFRDEHKFDGRRKPVRFLKRAQILVADLWACFGGESYGAFRDVDKITMFADYRVPQMLNSMGCLYYSPSLDSAIRGKRLIDSGSRWELQLRGKCLSAALDLTDSPNVGDDSLQYLVRRIDSAGDQKGTS
jgi:hypothetical protein